MTKLKRIEFLFLLTGFLFLTAYLILGRQTLDINSQDTYFVIYYKDLGIFFFIIHLVFSLVYYLIRKYQKVILGLLHLILGTPLFLFPILSTLIFNDFTSKRYQTNGDIDTALVTSFADSIYIFAIFFILGQILFLTNIIYSIIKAYRHHKRQLL